MYGHDIAFLNFYQNIKSRRRHPFRGWIFGWPRRFASSSPSVTDWIPPIRSARVGFIIRFSSVLPWAVATNWTPRSAIVRAACVSSLCADFIDDNDFRHVVFHCFNHHGVLHIGCRHLHPSRMSDGRVGDVAVAGNFIRSIDNNDTLMKIICQYPGNFAQHRGFTYAGPAQQQDTFSGFHQVFDDFYRAENSARPTRSVSPTILPLRLRMAEMRCKVRSMPALFIVAETADAGDDILNVFIGHFSLVEDHFPVQKAGFRRSPQV